MGLNDVMVESRGIPWARCCQALQVLSLSDIRAAIARGFDFICVGLSEIHLHTAKRYARGHCLAPTPTHSVPNEGNGQDMTVHGLDASPAP